MNLGSAIHFLALDLDGTILPSDGSVSPRLRAALRRATDNGIRVCLCTGRPLAATQEYAKALDPTTPPIVFNGALVPSPDGGPDIYHRALEPTIVQRLVDYGREHRLHLELHTLKECIIESEGPIAAFQRQKFHRELIVRPFDGTIQASEI